MSIWQGHHVNIVDIGNIPAVRKFEPSIVKQTYLNV